MQKTLVATEIVHPDVSQIDSLLLALQPRGEPKHILADQGAHSLSRRTLGATQSAPQLLPVPTPASTAMVGDADPSRNIQLRVKDDKGNEALFKVRQRAPLQRLMETYCSRMGLQVSQVRFMSNGQRIAAEDTAEKFGLEERGFITAFMELRHRYIHVSGTDGSSFAGHVIDVIPAVESLPEHICVRFCDGARATERVYQWFWHHADRQTISDGQSCFPYILDLDRPPVRTAKAMPYTLGQRLGLDKHRAPTASLLIQLLCLLAPHHLDKCLLQYCSSQSGVSTSMLSYGLLRTAGCAALPEWLEVFACTCDFLASVQRSGTHKIPAVLRDFDETSGSFGAVPTPSAAGSSRACASQRQERLPVDDGVGTIGQRLLNATSLAALTDVLTSYVDDHRGAEAIPKDIGQAGIAFFVRLEQLLPQHLHQAAREVAPAEFKPRRYKKLAGLEMHCLGALDTVIGVDIGNDLDALWPELAAAEV